MSDQTLDPERERLMILTEDEARRLVTTAECSVDTDLDVSPEQRGLLYRLLLQLGLSVAEVVVMRRSWIRFGHANRSTMMTIPAEASACSEAVVHAVPADLHMRLWRACSWRRAEDLVLPIGALVDLRVALRHDLRQAGITRPLDFISLRQTALAFMGRSVDAGTRLWLGPEVHHAN